MDNASTDSAITDEPCPILQVYLDVFYIYVFGIGPISLIGIIFNILTLYILNHEKNKMNSIFLLKLLAVSDLVFLLDCVLFFPFRHLYALFIQGDEIFRRWDPAIAPWLFFVTIPIYFMAQQNRNWLVVIISCDRFLHLVFPFWARRVLTKRRLIYAFIANVVISIACNVVNYWIYPVVPNVNPCTGEDEVTVIWQSWGREVDLWLFTLMTVLVPLFLLYIMNISLIVALNKMFSKRGEMTGGGNKDQQAQRQATMMVLGICICFSICETPASLDRMAGMVGIEFSQDDPFFNYARKVGLLLVVVDSAANFLSYICTNPRFRQGLAKLCCCKADENDKFHSGSSRDNPCTVHTVANDSS